MGTSRSRDRITKPCDHCGKPVTRLKSQDADRFYCDKSCYWSSASRADVTRRTNAERYPDSRAESTCAHCEKPINRPKSQVRARAFCSRSCQYAFRRAEGRKHVNSQGYVIVGVPADYPGAKRNGMYGQILEHRKVMQDFLGRALLPDENVHHLNGVRDDNRPENLELWTRSQPSGQRVEDKLQWARDFIQLYEGLSNSQEK